LAIPALFNVSGLIITALDKQKFKTYIQGFACVVNIVANIVLIKYFKAEGAAIATVLTYYVLNIIYNIFLVKYKYISMKGIAIVVLKQCFIFLAIYELYFTFLIRYHIIYNTMLVTLIYVVLVFILQIRKNDIRIMREIVGI
jgi:O-antigen/teichoic acid export membrane protein